MKDLGELMKQANALQSKMNDLQAKMDTAEIEGVAGGGLVKVTVTGRGQAKSVKIDPSLLKPDEAEVLEDLITAAFNDAKTKAENQSAEEIKKLTGGFPMPEGFKLPFGQ
ncbi:MAG: YbaB/EbfC family nucleoid-associated protein [Pseudomonadota bacterium]